jgi:hypothetical protein
VTGLRCGDPLGSSQSTTGIRIDRQTCPRRHGPGVLERVILEWVGSRMGLDVHDTRFLLYARAPGSTTAQLEAFRRVRELAERIGRWVVGSKHSLSRYALAAESQAWAASCTASHGAPIGGV